MLGFNKKLSEKNVEYDKTIIDNSTINVIVLASLTIVVSVFLMGGIGYYIAKSAVVQKLKSKDLIYIAQSITSKIDARISRAKETSIILSRDPVIIKWLEGREKDENLGKYSKQKIMDLAKEYDYSNSFIVSSLTNNYYTESGQLADTLSHNNSYDLWFFKTIESKKDVNIVIDYNKERKDTFVFINVLIGDINKPLGVTGIGLSLKDISEEFKSYKFGQHSNLWLVDSKGNIYLSDNIDQIGKNVSEFTTNFATKEIVGSNILKQDIFEYKNSKGEIEDVICEPIKSTEWKLVFQMPRAESISVLDSVKINTITACIITLILIIFIFFLISRKIADPYKRAVVLTRQLEEKVNERTRELKEKNTKIMDSIQYAKFIQKSILPPLEELDSVLTGHFIIWKPKDIVGGDFYFFKRLSHGYILAIGDCTGHGVPGALMTMTANSVLSNIVESICNNDPARILKEMNLRLKQALHGRDVENSIDDGLDAGIIYVSNERNLIYAGAKISLYKKNNEGLECFKGDRKGVGYKNTSNDYEFTNYKIDLKDDETFYITTDGYTDQGGGEKSLPFGKKRLKEVILKYSEKPLAEQLDLFQQELQLYMKDEEQRDDITVVAFKA
ncbi:SpoIIE family protein phosphatase [Clostridium thailandense]|uniref:SpoIIE family protein phosphatase n=1 Tax=Clostridium thailandense TaxID=2794346 RepID=UPI003989CE04